MLFRSLTSSPNTPIEIFLTLAKNFNKRGVLYYTRNIFILLFIQNGANSAKPSDWYQKYIYEEKKKQKLIYF
jgi:hypothetical protein